MPLSTSTTPLILLIESASFGDRTARGHDVIDDKTTHIHLGEQVGTEEVVTSVGHDDEREAQQRQLSRVLQGATQPFLMEVNDLEKKAANGGIFSRQQALNILFVLDVGLGRSLSRFAMPDKKLA